MDNTEALRMVAPVRDRDTPGSLIWRRGLAAFVSGEQPWAGQVRLNRVRPDARLLPLGVEPLLLAELPRSTSFVATGPGWTLHVLRWQDRDADLTVTAVSEAIGRDVLEAASRDAVDEREPDEASVVMGFWHLSEGARRTERNIDAASWSQIRGNYASSVASSLERLLACDPSHLSGRLVLLHGPPGSGKTTLLRALAHAWRSWCQVDYVLDPDRLLSLPAYLMSVVIDDDHLDDGDGHGATAPRWKLLVLEDCDELIRAEAKQGAGQNLARLLNLTDGLVGQGLDVLVCITTNEELSQLHPAVTRPGRCLAQIHVGRLPRAEAAAWLGTSDGIGPEGATLAELFARRGELDQITADRPDEPIGLYL